jgi:hypothetical protein
MKNKEEIDAQIKYAKDQLADAQSKLGGEHHDLYQELVHQMKGEISALEWVLDAEA